MGTAMMENNRIVFTKDDFKLIQNKAKELKQTPKQIVWDALARGVGFDNYKELLVFEKTDITVEFELDGQYGYSYIVEDGFEALGSGAMDQLMAQMFELDEV